MLCCSSSVLVKMNAETMKWLGKCVGLARTVYIHVYDRIVSEFPAKNTVCKPYIRIYMVRANPKNVTERLVSALVWLGKGEVTRMRTTYTQFLS